MEGINRQADLFDISGATNIHGTKFDNPKNPVSPNGVLDPSITPATYVPFVNFLDPVQLARFGLHNGMSSSPDGMLGLLMRDTCR